MTTTMNGTVSGIGRSGVMTGSELNRVGDVNKPKKKSFLQTLGSIGKGIGQVALGVGANLIPGGQVIAGAISGALGGGGVNAFSSAGGVGAAGGSMMNEMMAAQMQFFQLQQQVQIQSQAFQTHSNVSRARHEIAMNAIRNMKA
jgi:hypothetical protein